MGRHYNDGRLRLYELFNHDNGDITVKIYAEGIDGFEPTRQECTYAVSQIVKKKLVAPYKGEQE